LIFTEFSAAILCPKWTPQVENFLVPALAEWPEFPLIDFLRFCQFFRLKISPEFTFFLLEIFSKSGKKFSKFSENFSKFSAPENSEIFFAALEFSLPPLEILAPRPNFDADEAPAPFGAPAPMEIDEGAEKNLLRKCLEILNGAELTDFLLNSLKNVDQDARQMRSMARIAHSLLAVDSMQRNRYAKKGLKTFTPSLLLVYS
jgi:hypothetical protein